MVIKNSIFYPIFPVPKEPSNPLNEPFLLGIFLRHLVYTKIRMVNFKLYNNTQIQIS